MDMSEFQAAIERIAGIIRQESIVSQLNCVLGERSVRAIKEAGLLRLWRPAARGGFASSPLIHACLVEQLATVDTAAAWMMMSVSNTTFDLRYASADLVDEIFSVDDPILCETFNRPMTAHSVDNGYVVSGQTPFASNCKVADWIGHTATCGDAFLLVFHPREALQIVEDWNPTGMRASASNTIVANEVFVPVHRAIELSAPLQRNALFTEALFRMPEAIITSAFPPIVLGALRTALDEVQALAADKVPFAATSTLKSRPLAQHDYAKSVANYRSLRAYLHSELSSAFLHSVAERAFSSIQKADLFLATTHVLQTALDTAHLLQRIAGTSGIDRDNAIGRAVSDMQVIAQHAFGADSRYASVGQVYWGEALDFPLMEMD